MNDGGRGFGGLQAVGRDVGGAHAARDVHRQDDGRLAGRHADDRHRPAPWPGPGWPAPMMNRANGRWRRSREAGRQRVAHQRQAGVAHGRRSAAPQHPDIGPPTSTGSRARSSRKPGHSEVHHAATWSAASSERQRQPPASRTSTPAPANSEVTSISSGLITSCSVEAVVDGVQLVRVGGGVVRAVGDLRDLPQHRFVELGVDREALRPRASCRPGCRCRPCRCARRGRRRPGGRPAGPASGCSRRRSAARSRRACSVPVGHGRGSGGRLGGAVAVEPAVGSARRPRSSSARSGCPGRATCRAAGASRSIAASTSVWSSVGAWTEKPLSLNATTPISTLGGWRSTKRRAAALAASMRVGSMSSAAMLPETSKARITVPSIRGRLTTRLRAAPGRGPGSSGPTRNSAAGRSAAAAPGLAPRRAAGPPTGRRPRTRRRGRGDGAAGATYSAAPAAGWPAAAAASVGQMNDIGCLLAPLLPQLGNADDGAHQVFVGRERQRRRPRSLERLAQGRPRAVCAAAAEAPRNCLSWVST